MNWDELTEECARENGCSLQQLMAVSGNNRKLRRKLERDREAVIKVSNAVREAYEDDPTASRDQLRTKALGILSGSFLLGMLFQAIFGFFIRKILEWFLEKIFMSNEAGSLASKPTPYV